jgi:hypothetical protein
VASFEHGQDDDLSAASRPTAPRASVRLEEILRALPARELEGLAQRLGARVDATKRIDGPAQVARAIVAQSEIREPERLPSACRDLLYRIAGERGTLHVNALPPGVEGLVARGVLFVRRDELGFELIVPGAYLVQIPAQAREDARGVRPLLAQASPDVLSTIAGYYLGRPATPPLPMALEAAWEALSEPSSVRREVEALPLLERRLLESIDEEGGEVETAELLTLEREPMRLLSASGVSMTRRGASFALERRGMLVPVHPNRHVIPTEVAEIVGEPRIRALEARRAELRQRTLDHDSLPRRARYAADVAAVALATTIASRDAHGDTRSTVGTPRSLVQRLAQRFGQSPESISMVMALSRTIGLWQASATTTATPPGALEVGELGYVLFSTWLMSGAWDEARVEPERLRAPPDRREPSPVRRLRSIVLESLLDLSDVGWVSVASFERYVHDDPRIRGSSRLMRRWSERVAQTNGPPVTEVIRRITLESLHVLGVVDLGEDGAGRSRRRSGEVPLAPKTGRPTEGHGLVRLSQRGRSYLARIDLQRASDAPDASPKTLAPRAAAATPVEVPSSSSERPRSRFIDSHVLRIGPSARVGDVLALAQLADVGRIDEGLDLVLSPSVIARAISEGTQSSELRDRIEAVAKLPESLSQIIVQAGVVLGKAALVHVAGFLWVDDPEIRELLRTRRSTAELFVEPSPPGGLLIVAGVELDRLVRRCRGVGVEIAVGEGVDATLRAGRAPSTASAPEVRGSGSRSSASTRSRTPVPRVR